MYALFITVCLLNTSNDVIECTDKQIIFQSNNECNLYLNKLKLQAIPNNIKINMNCDIYVKRI